MQQIAIFYPVFILVLLTFWTGFWLIKCRYRAVKEGLTVGYFKHNRGAKIPPYLQQATQHYENLYEMPILFYVAVLVAYVTQSVDWGLVILAWGYVIARLIHSRVHLTHNKLKLRKNSFVASYFILLMMWLWLMVRIIC